MSYKINKPLSIQKKADFIVKHNYKKGLRIEETEKAIYALEAWELLEDDTVINNRDSYDAEQAQKKAEHFAKLSLTKREVFLALYNDSGITPDKIKSVITDPATLIEFEYATKYYRGNPLIDAIGNSLGYSKEQLDYLFENKSLPLRVKEPTEEEGFNA